ncbi:C2H2-type domain-containing protein [Mycena chlorophos]|uniref:C2H2-type domain-containing protein n=1 Tax=Mycena chlorophos TaxID=658473 RepID=A0A8H6RZW7_MYCCL|nr:C2H2-type domain-containing protein [Mycena chlorophos]
MSAVVLDFGSDTVKAGFAGEEAPLSVFPSVVARPRHGAVINSGDPAFYVGYASSALRISLVIHVTRDEALSHRPGWTIRRSIEGGIVHVQNWDDMEQLLAHSFRELNVASDAISPVLIAVPAQASPQHQTKLAQIIFEELSAPALGLQPSASLSLLSAGLESGVVLESGHTTTVAVPIHEGHILHDAVRSVGYAGQEITDLILHLLVREQGMHFAADDRSARAVVEELKHRKCYVAANYHEEVKCIPRLVKTEHTDSLSYELPDGQIVTMGSTRFVAPEALFQPSILGLDQPGITHLVYGAISHTPAALRASLLGNVLLSGGNTLFPGLANRLAAELVDVVSPDMRAEVNIHALPERRYLPWIGGSIFAAQNTFDKACLTKAEYDELGLRLPAGPPGVCAEYVLNQSIIDINAGGG